MSRVGTDTTSPRSRPPEFEPASMPYREGDIIAGKYEMIRPLGGGGMAFVLAARHLELDETVAVKVLRPECLANADLVARFDREARASVKIESDHVVRVFDVGAMPDGAPFVVMEHLDGKDLGTLLREEGAAPVDCASEFLLQACDALATAHAIGIVHRDIKPENLFLARCSQGLDVIKLLDFGISKLALTGSVFDSSGPRAKAMTSMGTPNYMSPEQIRGSTDIDGRSDIWSLGCVLHELLTGHAPFEAPSITMLTAMILERPAPLLRERRPDLPAEIEPVFARCLEKDPNQRFQNISELATALYPFAPRRARLSVEHCSHLLRNAGLPRAPIKLSSAPPPNGGRPNTTIPPPKPPSAPPRNSGHPNTTMTLPIADRTTTRTSGESAEVDVRPTTRRPRTAWVAGVCVLLTVGGFALYGSHVATLFTGTSSVGPAALGGSPLPTVTATAAATVDLPPTPRSLDVEGSEMNSPAAPGATTPKTTLSVSPSRKSRPAKSHPPTNSPQEIDVGF
jgi:eukaryotic-like serine/threonine-protein kinase